MPPIKLVPGRGLSQRGLVSIARHCMPPSLAAHALETAADAIVHVCPAGTVKTWNRGAFETFGFTADQALGSSLTELVIPEHVRHLRPLDPKPQLYRRHLRRAPASRADGTLFTAEFTVLELTANAGAPDQGAVVTLRDASAMGETVRTLRRRVAQLESGMERLVALARPSASSHEPECTPGARDSLADDEAPAAELVEALLASQVQCVLATTDADLAPCQYLMAYATSPCLREIFVATPLQARKAQQMLERPSCSLLWDNRTGRLADHGDGVLVTAVGRAAAARPEEGRARFLERNPNMGRFLASDGVALFRISVARFEIVKGYGRPRRWEPPAV